MPKVVFNNIDEFLQEITDRKPDRKIVRVTYLTKPSVVTPNIKHLSVSATCTIDGELVEYVEHCGDTWGIKDNDDAVYKAATEKLEKVTTISSNFGYDVRKGHLEEAK